jgi:hypothetical protein
MLLICTGEVVAEPSEISGGVGVRKPNAGRGLKEQHVGLCYQTEQYTHDQSV